MRYRSSTLWQEKLAEGLLQVSELLNFLGLSSNLGDETAEHIFQTKVPRGFAQRMELNNPNDPLLLQVLAQNKELLPSDSFIEDPLNEKNTIN